MGVHLIERQHTRYAYAHATLHRRVVPVPMWCHSSKAFKHKSSPLSSKDLWETLKRRASRNALLGPKQVEGDDVAKQV